MYKLEETVTLTVDLLTKLMTFNLQMMQLQTLKTEFIRITSGNHMAGTFLMQIVTNGWTGLGVCSVTFEGFL